MSLTDHVVGEEGRRMTAATSATRSSARVHVQKFGTFLSNMVMPNIGAFIAWGLITALFIKSGWLNAGGSGGLADRTAGSPRSAAGVSSTARGIVGPMITYLLPLLIGYTGGKLIYGERGGVVGAIATMGVIAGTDIPMFMGAMIMGPLGGWSIKKLRQGSGTARSSPASRCWSTTSPPASSGA
jgi:PTS system mannitol-specific IIC component